MRTNIGKVVFKLLHKHFPKTHKFYRIFNKNNVKLTYSSMLNMASIIASHNKIILRPNTQDYGCSCRKKSECPMQNKCLTPNIIYYLDLSGYKVIVKIQNYLNMRGT